MNDYENVVGVFCLFVFCNPDQQLVKCIFLSHLQLLNKELREAKSAKMKTNVTLDTQTSSLQSSHENHLPQSLPDMAASAQKASSALPVAPSTDVSPPAPTKPHLG